MQELINAVSGLYKKWNGTEPIQVDVIQQSGSDRRYFRLHGADGRTVIGTHGLNIPENEAFVYFAKQFSEKGLQVPEIVAVSDDKTVYLQQDFGDVSLMNILEEKGFVPEVYALFKESLHQLARLQVKGDEGLDYSKCLTNKEFGRQAIKADLFYFKYYFLDALRKPYDKQALGDDFDAISSYLTHTEYKYFMFRDFQSRNILIAAPPPPKGGLANTQPSLADEPEPDLQEPEHSYLTADPMTYNLLKEFVRTHRSQPTQAEDVLWQQLRGKQLEGIKFRRQHIVGNYIADFISLDNKLVVEVDGLIHQLPQNQLSDKERTDWLNSQGYQVLRFTNEEVINQTKQVLQKITASVKQLAKEVGSLQSEPSQPQPNPPSGGGGAVHFIDFQGGMKGAPQYDVASMLWQARANLPDEWKNSLLEEYMNAFDEVVETKIDRDVFKSQYNGYVLIRLLQVLGAYGFRGLFERKAQFLTSIPQALKNLKWFIDNNSMGISVPEFKRVLQVCIDDEIINRFTPVQATEETPLVVKVCSFSYRKGLPEDSSVHGGGFVFDCRGIDNPGRHVEYKEIHGRDRPVMEYLERQTRMQDFLNSVFDIVDISVEEYIKRGFDYLTVNFGCTGGQHRSVYAADAMARHLRNKYKVKIELCHREQELKGWKNPLVKKEEQDKAQTSDEVKAGA